MKCIGNPMLRTDGRTDVRMYGRTDGRSCDHYVTTKISWLDRLPNFLSNGAPLTRQRAGSAIMYPVHYNVSYMKYLPVTFHYPLTLTARGLCMADQFIAIATAIAAGSCTYMMEGVNSKTFKSRIFTSNVLLQKDELEEVSSVGIIIKAAIRDSGSLDKLFY